MGARKSVWTIGEVVIAAMIILCLSSVTFSCVDLVASFVEGEAPTRSGGGGGVADE